MPVTLIETSEEDSFLAVAAQIAELLNDGEAKTALAETAGSRFFDDCKNLVQEGKVQALMDRLVEHIGLVYSKCNAKDAEACVNIISHLLLRLEDGLPAATQKLINALKAQPEQRADEKLLAMMHLYNLLEGPELQYTVLLEAIALAQRSRATAGILYTAVKGKADEWVRQWQLPTQQARELYLALAHFHKTVGDKNGLRDFLKLSTTGLALVKADDKAGIAAVRDAAVAAVAEFIRNPDIFTCDLASLPAVAALAKDSKAAPLYSLLQALMAGDLKAFKAAATPATLEAAGTTEAAAVGKARLMALLALGAGSVHEEVGFSAVQAALGVEEAEVEAWLVRAIGKKLVEGKIDQARKVVLMTRCTHRTFGESEWQRVHDQLKAWQTSLQEVHTMIARRNLPTGPRGLPSIQA